jgi:GNAT superfamily N-acetyltransferase
MTSSRIEVRYEVEPARLPQLLELYAGEWWTAGREPADVEAMLAASGAVVALIDRDDDRLVGFARALTDGAYAALVLDVIVAPDRRGEGLGAAVVEALLSRLGDVRNVELTCQTALLPFYRRFGFTEQVGGSRLMRRTSDPRLTGPLPA